MVYSQKLKEALSEQFAVENIHVELAMQCGEPSIKIALDRLRVRGYSRIIVLPMYPQYASSTFGGAIEDLYREILKDWNMPQLQIIPPFFSEQSSKAATKSLRSNFMAYTPFPAPLTNVI